MKLELKKLVLLAQLNCYESKYDLMESEIYEEDIEEYHSDKRNFKEKMEEWFFDSISGRTEESDRIYKKRWEKSSDPGKYAGTVTEGIFAGRSKRGASE